MRAELIQLFDRVELSKYLTDEELAEFDAAAGNVAANSAGVGRADKDGV
jgi:succinate dehydrogenase / fumarate reductase flavoprotein subunit